MSKRKRKKQRKSLFNWKSRRSRQPSVELQQTLDEADHLIGQGQAREAVELLEPLLASYPRVAELYYYLGYAYFEAGNMWGSVEQYEQAMKLGGDPSIWLPLATLYLGLELNAHALHAFRQVLKQQPPDDPLIDKVDETIASLEQSVLDTARTLDLSTSRVEKGLRELERGQRILHAGDFPACIAANRRAIKLLPNWPPPYNNLSLALFFSGQPQEAITTARRVLSIDPNNIQALSNAIRFLTWTGQEAEAQTLWGQLQEITPGDTVDRLKMAEAAAVLEEDESICQLLKPLDEPDAEPEGSPQSYQQVQLFLAVAEANLGRPGAQDRLKALQHDIPRAGELLVALQAKKPGPGWAERFPYYHSTDFITGWGMEEFVNLVIRKDKLPPKKFGKEMTRFVARFPQITRVAEKLIWEENQPDLGLQILTTIATPMAYAALRRFGLSQAGDDDHRMQALLSLVQAGEIAEDETLRVWHQGQWREVQLRQYEISDEFQIEHSPEVLDLLDQALQASKQNDEQAEYLFRQVLELDPHVKEAYNNLGAIYSRRGQEARAKEMFQAALDVDPTYVFPRCNLALYLLNEDDIEGAEALLAPLADVRHFYPQGMAFYSYIQARIFMYHEEYEAARNSLEAALGILPDYEPARDLLDHLDRNLSLFEGFRSFAEHRRERDQVKRAQLQAKLTSPDPSLSEVLSLYTKDALTGMARRVIPWGGWSGLRKAELIQQIVNALIDRDWLEAVVDDLRDEERAALRQVLASGSSMSWPDFDARYGNDLEESPYWNWHLPETTMGRLRLRGLLAEATVDGQLLVVVPSELRQILAETLDK